MRPVHHAAGVGGGKRRGSVGDRITEARDLRTGAGGTLLPWVVRSQAFERDVTMIREEGGNGMGMCPNTNTPQSRAAHTFNSIERVYSRAIAFSGRRCSVPLESSLPMTMLCTPGSSICTWPL